MIDIAIDIVKKHLDEYYPNVKFNAFTSANGKGYLFFHVSNWGVRVALELTDEDSDEVTFSISNRVRKKKILEGQLKLIGCVDYSDRWDCYGFEKVPLRQEI